MDSTVTGKTVTVITVMIDDAAVVAALQPEWPDVAVEANTPLTVGQWATMARLRLTGIPTDVPADLVLRVAPDPELGAKELAVQASMADTGIPTPRVRLTGPAGGPLTGAWALMDHAAGTSLISGLDGGAAIRRFPGLLGRLPVQLADTMTAIHGVDPGPVAEQVRRTAPGAPMTIDQLWPHLRAGAEAAERADLEQALVRLADRQPDQTAAVLCHGDLHPLNLLQDEAGVITVLDWTAAIVAPAGYDVALTHTFLRHPPLDAPAALRAVINVGASFIARGFLRRYRQVNPTIDLADLAWYRAFHAARILVEVAIWAHDGDARTRTHPWRLLAPTAASSLRGVTGIQLQFV
jgi:aminoglycoside phosphotransferase (APT) family kinase protein